MTYFPNFWEIGTAPNHQIKSLRKKAFVLEIPEPERETLTIYQKGFLSNLKNQRTFVSLKLELHRRRISEIMNITQCQKKST